MCIWVPNNGHARLVNFLNSLPLIEPVLTNDEWKDKWGKLAAGRKNWLVACHSPVGITPGSVIRDQSSRIQALRVPFTFAHLFVVFGSLPAAVRFDGAIPRIFIPNTSPNRNPKSRDQLAGYRDQLSAVMWLETGRAGIAPFVQRWWDRISFSICCLCVSPFTANLHSTSNPDHSQRPGGIYFERSEDFWNFDCVELWIFAFWICFVLLVWKCEFTWNFPEFTWNIFLSESSNVMWNFMPFLFHFSDKFSAVLAKKALFSKLIGTFFPQNALRKNAL